MLCKYIYDSKWALHLPENQLVDPQDVSSPPPPRRVGTTVLNKQGQ